MGELAQYADLVIACASIGVLAGAAFAWRCGLTLQRRQRRAIEDYLEQLAAASARRRAEWLEQSRERARGGTS
jgi:Flp pilus assembly protein TadB